MAKAPLNPYQIGLLLMLAVIVTYLICLISVYISSFVLKKKSESCVQFCHGEVKTKVTKRSRVSSKRPKRPKDVPRRQPPTPPSRPSPRPPPPRPPPPGPPPPPLEPDDVSKKEVENIYNAYKKISKTKAEHRLINVTFPEWKLKRHKSLFGNYKLHKTLDIDDELTTKMYNEHNKQKLNKHIKNTDKKKTKVLKHKNIPNTQYDVKKMEKILQQFGVDSIEDLLAVYGNYKSPKFNYLIAGNTSLSHQKNRTEENMITDDNDYDDEDEGDINSEETANEELMEASENKIEISVNTMSAANNTYNMKRLERHLVSLQDDEFGLDEENNERCQIAPEEDIKYPFLVSIVQLIYRDSLNGLRYLCSGSIISKKWVISTQECFQVKDAILEEVVDRIYIRGASNFWSKQGITFKIVKVVFARKSGAIVAFKSEHNFLNITSMLPANIKYERKGKEKLSNFQIIKILGWHASEKLDYSLRRKYGKYQARAIVIKRKVSCERNVGEFCATTQYHYEYCQHFPGAPLIKGNSLIGFSIASDCSTSNTVFYFVGLKNYKSWIEMLIRS